MAAMNPTDDKKRVREQRLAQEEEFVAEGKKAWERLNAGQPRKFEEKKATRTTRHASFDHLRASTSTVSSTGSIGTARLEGLRKTLPCRISEGTPYVVRPSDHGAGVDLCLNDLQHTLVAPALSMEAVIEFFAARKQIADYDRMLAFEQEYLKASAGQRRAVFERYYQK